VGINTDASIKRIKGKNRPITPLAQRMQIISALEAVDYVISFSEDTPYNLIKEIKPDLLIKGGDWDTKEIVGKDIVESYGGKVITIPYIKGISTTGIIKKIVKRFGG
jgi:rfaE bifunctional protein nucleotidyltransferase chain/domain